MCSIFGTNINDIEKFKKLAIAGEERGTDATGITSIDDESFQMIKGDVRAKKINYNELEEGDFYLGHTRKTTQGNEEDNQNNHPFVSQDNTLLLAHNGVIYNDDDLWTYETDVETDSFVALQQLEKEKGDNELTIDDVKTVCEKLRGSFTLTIIDIQAEKLFLLRHSNPLQIMYNSETGDIVYASLTNMIREGYGNETDYNTFIGQTEENVIYEFDLKESKFINQKEFTPNIKTNSYSKKRYNYQDIYFDEEKEEFNLKRFKYHHFDTDRPFSNSYSVYNYEKCDFCGVWYRDDSYTKAGITKEDKHICAFCWEEDKNTVTRRHRITDEILDEVADFKVDLQLEKEDKDKDKKEKGKYYALDGNSYAKLPQKEKMKYIFCSECKMYYHEDYDVMSYDNQKKTFVCKHCREKEEKDKPQIEVV